MQIQLGTKNLIINQERIARQEFKSEIKCNTDQKKTALIYCENQFGLVDGKTAAALVRHSEIYTIVGVIDSSLTGKMMPWRNFPTFLISIFTEKLP